MILIISSFKLIKSKLKKRRSRWW